jgi:LemA protein
MDTIASLAFLLAIFGLIVYVVTIFNGLIAVKNDIAKAWANIDILLKQRHDELSKLLDVCKGYMEFERDALQEITQARSMYQQAVSVDQKAQADQSMTSALRGFFAVAENYPQLKANDNFMRLQVRITELESEIADRREFYNDSVNTFNIRIQQMPDPFVASFMTSLPAQCLR